MSDGLQLRLHSDMRSEPGDAHGPHAILVAGYWLGAWAWDAVIPRLVAAGICVHPVDLPGLDGRPGGHVTLEDHIAAVVALIDRAGGDIVLVGHSGGGLVVQGAVDRRPGRVRRVVYVDSGPLEDGVSLHPDAVADIDLPGWEDLTEEGSSIEGIDASLLETFRDRARPQPAGVAASPIRLHDERRHAVPVTIVCTSLPSTQLTFMIDAGHIPSEVRSLHDVRYVDLPTGHWPMFSRPDDLADLLVGEFR